MLVMEKELTSEKKTAVVLVLETVSTTELVLVRKMVEEWGQNWALEKELEWEDE